MLAVFCYVLVCLVVLFCAMSCHIVLCLLCPSCRVTLRCVVKCCPELCCVVLCCAVLCCVVLCCAVLCCVVQCCAVLCCVVSCCVVLCRLVSSCVMLCCVLFQFASIRCGLVWLAVPSHSAKEPGGAEVAQNRLSSSNLPKPQAAKRAGPQADSCLWRGVLLHFPHGRLDRGKSPKLSTQDSSCGS